MALAMAEGTGATELHIGANAVDYSGYPDCRPEFIAAFDALAAVATKAGVEGNPIRVKAPLLHMSKAEIIRAGIDLGVDYGLTCSCYDPVDGSRPCGSCEACVLRAAGFAGAGVRDPLLEAST
jgi:7-cyano-7-deazaguanine synthase